MQKSRLCNYFKKCKQCSLPSCVFHNQSLIYFFIFGHYLVKIWSNIVSHFKVFNFYEINPRGQCVWLNKLAIQYGWLGFGDRDDLSRGSDSHKPHGAQVAQYLSLKKWCLKPEAVFKCFHTGKLAVTLKAFVKSIPGKSRIVSLC